MNTSPKDGNPTLRQIAALAYPGSLAKGLARDAGVAPRTSKDWLAADRIPDSPLRLAAGRLDMRLARVEAVLRLARQRIKREAADAAAREALSRRDRDRLRPVAARMRPQIVYAPR